MTAGVDLHPLASVALGDLVTLPDGKRMSVRSRVSLPVPEGTMAGFVILGELELLLSLPPNVRDDFGVYVPISHIPDYAADAKSVFEGVTAYWSPHLPALSAAMGELAWRVLKVRNRLDPIVLVYRGSEMVVFVKASSASPADLSVLFMPRTADDGAQVVRQSALVGSPVPTPAAVPASAPQRVAVPVR